MLQRIQHIVIAHRQKVFYLLLCGLMIFGLSACCNDHQIAEILRNGNDTEQGLRNANEEQYMIFVYIEYNRVLKENTMRFAGHYWDKSLTIISFLSLIGALVVIWLFITRVRWVNVIYKFADGQPDILLNCACLSAFILNVCSLYGYTAMDLWYVPVAVMLFGMVMMVVVFYYPRPTQWLLGRWQKYIRYFYLAAYAVFAAMCWLNSPPIEVPIY